MQGRGAEEEARDPAALCPAADAPAPAKACAISRAGESRTGSAAQRRLRRRLQSAEPADCSGGFAAFAGAGAGPAAEAEGRWIRRRVQPAEPADGAFTVAVGFNPRA